MDFIDTGRIEKLNRSRFYLTLSVSLSFIIIFSGCDEPGPDTIPKTMLQEYTPWPSLADSPWPMYRGNPHNTGRSEYVGPKLGTIKWEFVFDTSFVHSGGGSVSLDSDGNIYFITHRGFLYSVDPQGKERWRRVIGPETGKNNRKKYFLD